MKIDNIRFGEDQLPSQITVTMSVDEAAMLVRHCGTLSHVTAGPNANGTHALYDCLVASVFNRYWEDGVDDYWRNRR